MVHSVRTVVVQPQKHFYSWLSSFCNSTSIVMNCTYAAMSQSSIMAYVNDSLTCFQVGLLRIIFFNPDYLSPIFHSDCTRWCWFPFLIHYANKSQHYCRGTTTAAWLYHKRNLSIHVIDGITVTSIFVSLKHNTRPAADRTCQMAKYRKLLHEFEKRIKYHVAVERNRIKWDLQVQSEPCNQYTSVSTTYLLPGAESFLRS